MKKLLVVLLAFACSSAVTAKNMPLPDNVTLRPSGSRTGDYIDTVSMQAGAASFSKLKLCLAQNVRNPTVLLSGSTDAPFTFWTSNKTQTTAVQGSDIFKYQDEGERAVIVMGSIEGDRVVLSRSIIRFELTAVTDDGQTTLRFGNIERATEDTATVHNSGFLPVGAWKGARPLSVIEALNGLAGRISACLGPQAAH